MFNVTEEARAEIRKKLEEMEQPESPVRLVYQGLG